MCFLAATLTAETALYTAAAAQTESASPSERGAAAAKSAHFGAAKSVHSENAQNPLAAVVAVHVAAAEKEEAMTLH